MPDCKDVALANKTFSSISEDEIIVSLVGTQVDGSLDSGSRFLGTLDGFNENWLFIRGHRAQAIMIKRRKVSRLAEAVGMAGKHVVDIRSNSPFLSELIPHMFMEYIGLGGIYSHINIKREFAENVASKLANFTRLEGLDHV